LWYGCKKFNFFEEVELLTRNMMNTKKGEVPDPPEAPDIERRLEFDTLQRIGIPILLLVPLLALLGVFGDSSGSRVAETPEAALHVTYPSRMRHGLASSLRVDVRNRSPRPLSNVTVAISRDYLEPFRDLSFMPELTAVHETAYLLEIGDVPPGEERLVLVELRGWEHGRYPATVTVTIDGVENVQTTFTTIVFP
jgi:hypothetical protein